MAKDYPPPNENPKCVCFNEADNPMAAMFCPYGHLTECHYPLTCAEAMCAHFDIDEAIRLMERDPAASVDNVIYDLIALPDGKPIVIDNGDGFNLLYMRVDYGVLVMRQDILIEKSVMQARRFDLVAYLTKMKPRIVARARENFDHWQKAQKSAKDN